MLRGLIGWRPARGAWRPGTWLPGGSRGHGAWSRPWALWPGRLNSVGAWSSRQDRRGCFGRWSSSLVRFPNRWCPKLFCLVRSTILAHRATFGSIPPRPHTEKGSPRKRARTGPHPPAARRHGRRPLVQLAGCLPRHAPTAPGWPSPTMTTRSHRGAGPRPNAPGQVGSRNPRSGGRTEVWPRPDPSGGCGGGRAT